MAENDIKGLVRETAEGDLSEDLTNGVLPILDGSRLVGVIGNTYLAATSPGSSEDGFGSSLVFNNKVFEIGQRWFDFNTNKHYLCIDNSFNSARWVEAGLDGSFNEFIAKQSVNIDKGDILRIDDGMGAPANSVVRSLDTGNGIVGVAVETPDTSSTDVPIRVISNGIIEVNLETGIMASSLLAGDQIYISSSEPGQATNIATTSPIGVVVESGTSKIFVGVAAGGGSGGGMTDLLTIAQTDKVITSNYSIDPNYNGVSTGPVTIDTGVTISVPVGSRWIIL